VGGVEQHQGERWEGLVGAAEKKTRTQGEKASDQVMFSQKKTLQKEGSNPRGKKESNAIHQEGMASQRGTPDIACTGELNLSQGKKRNLDLQSGEKG